MRLHSTDDDPKSEQPADGGAQSDDLTSVNRIVVKKTYDELMNVYTT